MDMSKSLDSIRTYLKEKRIKKEHDELLQELYDLSDEINQTLTSTQGRLDKIIHKMEVLSDD